MVADNVFDFQTLGDRGDLGVAFLTELRGLEGTLNILRDRRRPDSAAMLARGAHFWYPSADGRFTYVLQVDRDGERGIIGDNERGTTCKLASREEVVAYNPGFLPKLGFLTWTEPDPADDNRTLRFVGRPEDCGGARSIGAGLELFVPLSTGGLLYATGPDSEPPTFFHLPAWDGAAIDGRGDRIMSHVDSDQLAFVGDAPEALVLGTLPSAAEGRGLFLYGPLAPAR
jgi:hypothetical protein